VAKIISNRMAPRMESMQTKHLVCTNRCCSGAFWCEPSAKASGNLTVQRSNASFWWQLQRNSA